MTSCIFKDEFLFKLGYSSFPCLTTKTGHYSDEFFMPKFVHLCYLSFCVLAGKLGPNNNQLCSLTMKIVQAEQHLFPYFDKKTRSNQNKKTRANFCH